MLELHVGDEKNPPTSELHNDIVKIFCSAPNLLM